jgi:hypothetical protein
MAKFVQHCCWLDKGYWHYEHPRDSCGRSSCLHGYVRAETGNGGPLLACPNNEFCAAWYPTEFHDCWGGRCCECDVMLRHTLVFRDTEPDWECPVCYEHHDRAVEHPAECGHLVCMPCLRRMCGMYREWTHETLADPREFGCPPCEHGNNPADCPLDPQRLPASVLPMQYGCGDCLSQWETSDTDAYHYWDDELDRREEQRQHDDAFEPTNCPLCRANVAAAPNASWH